MLPSVCIEIAGSWVTDSENAWTYIKPTASSKTSCLPARAKICLMMGRTGKTSMNKHKLNHTHVGASIFI